LNTIVDICTNNVHTGVNTQQVVEQRCKVARRRSRGNNSSRNWFIVNEDVANTRITISTDFYFI
jgi:hypothetical protein